MQASTNNVFPCYNCGNHNVIGVRSCGYCQATLYYNCPHCQAWVDNTFLNCPGCGKPLNWPPTGAYMEDTYITNQSRSPALLLIVCSVVLLVITFALVENSTNSAKAGANTPAYETLQATPSNDAQETDTPYKQTPYSPASNTGASTYTSTGYALPVDAGTSSKSEIDIKIPSTSDSTYVPKSSSYLNSVYPGWGRCSGGRCSGMTP
ncbi:MAG: zinc ribbon domain-containing protein [Dehalococcoidia bacterium]|nr:zinc ribbon domain-containing protein [Dehalococcoidia bacterium]